MSPADASSRHVHPKQPALGKPSAAISVLSLAKQIAGPALLILIVFAVYSPSLTFDFILDDHRFTADPRIQESGHIYEYFSNYVWAQFSGGPPSFYRPVFVLWMRLSFVLSELSPWGWHFLSILKHLLVGIALWLLIDKLLRDRVAAFAGAALFLLHPSNTESVSWVTVPDPLVTLGLFLSLLFYWKSVEGSSAEAVAPKSKPRKASKPATRNLSGIWLAASLSAYFAALLVKETAIVFPLVILVVALSAPDTQLTNERPSRKEQAEPPRKAFFHIALFGGVILLYLLLRWNALGGNLAAATQHLPLSTVVLSWPTTLWFYVKAILWPIKSYSFADPDLVSSFTGRGVLLPLLGLLCCTGVLVAFIAWAWKTAQLRLESEAGRVKFGLLSGMLLLILPLLLTLNLNALNPGDFLHGRYVYLSLAGGSVLVASAVHLAQKLRPLLLATAGVVAITFVAFTWSQQKQWKDDTSVFTVAHQLAPHNRPVAQHLADTRVKAALVIADEGRCAEAMPVFDEVNREFPDDWYSWAGRGICFVHANDLVRAEEALHRAADLSHDPTVVQQWQALRAHMGLSISVPAN